jgi:cytochrome c oxidase cbb3-type subunit III
MLLTMRKKSKYIIGLLTGMLLMACQPVWAAGPPAPSAFSNPLAVTLVVLMLLLLIIIGILANILLGTADLKLKKKKLAPISKPVASAVLLLLMMTIGPSLFAQDTATQATATSSTIGGMAASTFYVMATVIFLELFIIIALLINIKFLLKNEKEKVLVESGVSTIEARKSQLSWWDKFNSLRPITQEAELDLGHDYDGIRELNNRLPPWWLYGFYLTIIVAGIYLYRFHISHDGPSSKEEYDRSVASAELKISEYLKLKGDAVDENTVKLLTSKDDLAEGKAIFTKSCVTCHTETGGGNIGPNLTDNYWLHGNDIKSVFKTIRYGINAMPPWQNQYSNKQIALVASYVKSLHGTNPPNPKAPQGVEMKEEVTAPAVDSLKAKPGADTVKKVTK